MMRGSPSSAVWTLPLFRHHSMRSTPDSASVPDSVMLYAVVYQPGLASGVVLVGALVSGSPLPTGGTSPAQPTAMAPLKPPKPGPASGSADAIPGRPSSAMIAHSRAIGVRRRAIVPL